MEGLKAYKTYLGMVLHFKNSGYDGWLYSFAGKCSPEKFDSQRQLKYQFAAIERDNPTKFDQIRYFYPGFAKYNFVKANDVRTFARAYKEFDKNFSSYYSELLEISTQTKNIDELVGVYNSLPFLYNEYLKNEVSLEFLIVLSLVMPSILKIKSEETILWSNLCENIIFHKEFYKLYINLTNYKAKTVKILKEIWHDP